MAEADYSRDTLESLMVMHGGRGRIIYWFFLCGLIAIIAVLPLVRVEVSVGVPGIVTSNSERIPIHAPADGYIKKIKARENQEVRKGDVLLVIESPVLLEKIALNRAQRDTIEKQLADIAMLLSAMPGAIQDGAPEGGVISPDAFQTAHYLGQYDLLSTQLVSNEVQLNRNERDYKRVLSLHGQKLISDQALDDALFARDTTKTARQQLVRQSTSLWRTNQLSLQNSMPANLGEAAQLDRQLETYTIRASEDGVLMGFAGMSPGNYVLGASKLGDLSPDGGLVVDAYVPPKDIGAVRLGQAVLVQVDCFPYTEWGTLKGCVVEISPDIVQNG
jgi:HlyD family secretion protein